MTLLDTKFDYASVETTQPGTEERGIATLRMCMNFAKEVMLDALELNNQAVAAGNTDTGLAPDVLWGVVVMKAKMENERLAEMMEEAEPQIAQFVIQHIQDKQLVTLNMDGTYSACWEPSEPEEQGDPALKEFELDGVAYPLVTHLAPWQIHYYAEHPEEFQKQFPKGKWDAIRFGSRHLREGITTFYENDGKFMYHRNV